MTKYVCDCCGADTERDYVTERAKGVVRQGETELYAQIVLGVGRDHNVGHLCIDCAIVAANGVLQKIKNPPEKK